MEFGAFNFLLQLLGVLLAIAVAAYIYLKNVTYNYWKHKGIPQAEPIVPFGSLWDVVKSRKSIAVLMRDLYLEFKDNAVFGFYSFHRPSLVIRDPDLIRFVLTKDFSHFQNRGLYYNEEVDPLSGHLFMLDGAKWKNLRIKFSPTFTSGKMKHMFTTVKECSDSLVQCVTDEVEKNEVIEIKDIMARFTTDVIASVAFGIECNSLKNPEAEFRTLGRKIVKPRPVMNAMLVLCPSLLKMFNIAATNKEVSNFIIKVFKETVDYRTSNNLVRKDFLDLVIQLMNKGFVRGDDDKEPLDKPEIASGKITMLEGAAQVFVFWLAGFETSSSAATHCLYELAINQDIQKRLADEISQILEKFGGITYESLAAMPYLHKVVSETLRKYPSVPILNRDCNQDVQLPGINLSITKGTAIVIPLLGLHMDPEVYPEPDKFDPERFNDDNIARRHRYAYLPFGEGPRICIGELSLVIVEHSQVVRGVNPFLCLLQECGLV
ncbi:cytochrome P450 6A1-like isoform X2 [Diprion similis]|uniref:cytochrome P450 6A1-like isoform X2 n=1 Tax=Diprion similis TaxID=362088 RepID=UPI001EF94154|nr:cytochrome P450 6A1-like isoform X2 [Diprion similis]